MKGKLPLITIMGPTGVGKTNLVIALSSLLPSDIISVDSVQVYKKMDIGSGKPSESTLRKFPHKLVNIIDPWETYSTAIFCADSTEEINKSHKLERIPLLVGGTMLYFKSLLRGISKMPKSNSLIRKKITDEAKLKGWPSLHKHLAALDPESASRIHPNDAQRIQRALEVYEISHKTMSLLKKENKAEEILSKYKVFQFAIKPESKEQLRENVQERFLKMLDDGLVKEVERLLSYREMDNEKVSMKAIGYRQVVEYLEGKINYEELIYKAVNATRQLAKRQMTWLRSWRRLIWIPYELESSIRIIKSRTKI